MAGPGLLIGLKEAVTALMAVVIIASVYGGIRSKEVSGALSITFVFSSVFAVALWATAMLGLDLVSSPTSTAGTIAFYIAVIWAGIVIVLLILTLGFVISAIIAFNEVLALRSFIADMRTWTGREVGLWLPTAIVRGIAGSLKDEMKRLYVTAYVFAAAATAYAFYLVFLVR
jgi:hypothetical protein